MIQKIINPPRAEWASLIQRASKSYEELHQAVMPIIQDVKKEGANKDMLYGALWCIGGIVATVADFGFIFWGAIVFGAIQFIKGATNS